MSQFSGYSEEIEHFTRDLCKPHLKSCLQLTKHAPKKQEVNTRTNCEHSYRMEHAEHFSAPMEMCMDDHLTQTTERIQRQHLQDKTYEQNCPNRHSMLSTLTQPRRVQQNFQQLEMESSNMMVLPCFNYNAEATTHVETSKNVHDKGTLSTSLKMDTNMNANMDTNHIAHQYRHTGKEVHLLSEPSELRPLKAMAH